ncbi:cytochrome P450 93A3 [Artemisia annua]|uniref:Cytochrome P450 93A3 n=1 Tax=Artemisia annua TaxID=35608 RepID=A0A2U1KGG1_ARTAN|nr:cytochrome P450 93A3 [Artemisia annua]
MEDVQSCFLIILTLLISTLLIRAFLKYTRSKPHLPPSPFAIPIIGHLHLFAPIPHQAFHKLSLRYGPVFRLLMGSVPCVVVGTPVAAKEFLKTYENSFLDRPYNSATAQMTYGSKDFAFAQYGSYWRFMKKIFMSQLLNGTTIDLLLPVRQDEINHFVKFLSQNSNVGKALDLNAELVKVTNNLISRVLLGKRCSEEEGEAGDIKKLIFEKTETMERIIKEHEDERMQRSGSQGKDLLSILLDITEAESMDIDLTRENIKAFILNIFVAGTDNVAITTEWAIAELINHPNIMKKAKEEIDQRIIKEHEDERMQRSGSQGKDLLSILLDITEAESMDIDLTRENIKAFILNIFVAGTDNVAITTEWAIAELINHPNIMKKAKEEIDQVVGKTRLLQESDVPNLPYLQAIIKETLRLHPPVPMIPRKSTKDRKAAGFHIPANTTIFINVWALGRDPNTWENPLEFRPERFEEKQVDCFDWKVGTDGNLTSVDMDEGLGLNLPRANPLVCIPVARIDPIPLPNQGKD